MRDWLAPIYRSNKFFPLVYGVIISVLIWDTSMARISQFTVERQSSELNLVSFYFIVSVFVIGQYILIAFVRSKLRDVQSGILHDLLRLSKILALYQCVLVAVLVVIALQISLSSGYERLLLQTVLWLAYIEAIVFIGILTFKFLQWLRIQRSYIILLYFSGSIALIMMALITLFHANESILNYPSHIRPHVQGYLAYIGSQDTLSIVSQMTLVASYASLWLATIVLLRSHSSRFGKARYRVIVTLPFIYFILQYQPLFLEIFNAYRLSDPIGFGIVYTLFFSSSSIVGGIFFGIAFWSIARQASSTHIKALVILSAYGIILFFVSNQAILLANAPYPPFALAAISFVGLAAFLFLVGIYSSSISIASNASFRRSLKGTIIEQLKLLDTIGEAQYRRELENRVLSMAKRNLNPVVNELGVNASMTEEDVKDYIGQVIDELKKGQK
ncbi:MAG TPA: hypothetical protein VKA40_03575 [Nitrososphaera sp.]|jgi:hypothetical protein|nr:hypothetical protein [Nitrososphaera sp.]HKI08947.1 hypothetical protein [Nitrososphaeraceae archaeon]